MRRIEIDWYNANDLGAAWDAAEVDVEAGEFVLTLCPFVGQVAGPDTRWVASVDVPNGNDDIWSLAPPVLTDSREAAMKAIEDGYPTDRTRDSGGYLRSFEALSILLDGALNRTNPSM